MHCQQKPNNVKQTIVSACHRKWCNLLDKHCDKGRMDFGDRTKHRKGWASDEMEMQHISYDN